MLHLLRRSGPLLSSQRVSRSLFSSSLPSLSSSSSPFRPSPSSSSPSSSSSSSSPISSTPSSNAVSSSSTESFATATSAAYEESMYEAWKKDRSSVHTSWAAYFAAVEAGLPPHLAHNIPHNLGFDQNVKVPLSALSSAAAAAPVLPLSSKVASEATPSTVSAVAIKDSVRMFNLARAFQRNGHHMATLDPLNRSKEEKIQPKFVPRDLEPSYWGFKETDLDRPVYIEGNVPVLSLEGRSYVTVREAVSELRRVYCGNIGVEFTHLKDDEMIQFIRRFMEMPRRPYTKEERMLILDRLAWSDMFERFLDTKYGGAKRFGLEGCEALIPGLKALIDEAAEHGCEDIVIGMPHRGRLNTLANVIRKPLPAIFCEFKGMDVTEGSGSGDVKYHLGTSYKRRSRTGKKISLYLSANPSHLEAVNPVVSGRTRAMQYEKADHTGEKVCAVLMHGDAAFAGQGVVYESLHLNDLPNYSTHGSIHVVVNNQIGFTTDPLYSRSTPHPTDVAKNVNAPIVHVNADDIESVVRVFTLAAEFRQRFREDFVVDLVGYRRYGHNEIDPADMTQPLMYHLIAKHPPVLKLYTEFLLKEGICTQSEVDEVFANIKKHLETGFEESKTYTSLDTEWRESRWKDLRQIWQGADKPRPTNITRENFNDIGKHLVSVPSGFTLHKQIKKIMEKKEEMFRSGKGFDWGTAEAIAFGSLLKEGMHVRLSGQDVERGTFSHRHAVLHDQVNGSRYVPLDHVRSSRSHAKGFSVNNSSLSEFAVLGFELGYSLEDPNFLVLWEAQFGDFANGAQIIIDQFISSGEQKWKRQSGLVLLLPHGYDGQGPEHSSARLERFLSMTDSQPDEFPDLSSLEKRQAFVHGCNWQVCNVTNPANYYHLLRRQLHRPFRKPLCLMSPKNLLRHPLCVSNIEEFTDVELFTRVYSETFPDEIHSPKDVKRLVLCTGKIYYELLENRRKENVKDVALIRVEQLAPFPFDLIVNEFEKYPNAEIVWCQEEPQNMGAWYYMYFHLQTAMKNSSMASKGKEPLFIGRPSAASPAAGNYKVHMVEQKQILDRTLLLAKEE